MLGPGRLASLTALVWTVLSVSGGMPVMPRLASWSPDSAGVMYGAGRPPAGTAGYHRETIRAASTLRAAAWMDDSAQRAWSARPGSPGCLASRARPELRPGRPALDPSSWPA